MHNSSYISSGRFQALLAETFASLGAPYASVRGLAHEVKAGDLDAIDRAALIMRRWTPPNSILIPIPNHGGVADYTMKLAQRIAQLSKSTVLDVLTMKGNGGESLYNLKKSGEKVSGRNLGMRCQWSREYQEMIRKSRNVILIDNVLDSGTTASQAREAVKAAYGVDAWPLTLGAVVEPSEKSNDIIRSFYNRRGKGFYESKENKDKGKLDMVMDTKKKTITLTEDGLHRLIGNIINEMKFPVHGEPGISDRGMDAMGKAFAKANSDMAEDIPYVTGDSMLRKGAKIVDGQIEPDVEYVKLDSTMSRYADVCVEYPNGAKRCYGKRNGQVNEHYQQPYGGSGHDRMRFFMAYQLEDGGEKFGRTYDDVEDAISAFREAVRMSKGETEVHLSYARPNWGNE